MPIANFVETYSAGVIFSRAQAGQLVDSIEEFLNVTKLDGDNIQTGGVPTIALANQAVTAAKIASSAIGAGLTGGAGSPIDAVVDDATIEIASDKIGLKNSGLSTAKLADGVAATAPFANSAVTLPKEVANILISGGSGTFSTTSASPVYVSNTSLSFTSIGRPVRVTLGGLVGATSKIEFFTTTVFADAIARLYIRRNGVDIAYTAINYFLLVGSAPSGYANQSGLSIIDMDAPAGTNTYAVYASISDANTTLGVQDMALFLEEL